MFGITVGVFDLFHVGHLNLLERCKTMCDHLIVAVKCVDEVIPVSIEETEDKMLLIKKALPVSRRPGCSEKPGLQYKEDVAGLRTPRPFARDAVAFLV